MISELGKQYCFVDCQSELPKEDQKDGWNRQSKAIYTQSLQTILNRQSTITALKSEHDLIPLGRCDLLYSYECLTSTVEEDMKKEK